MKRYSIILFLVFNLSIYAQVSLPPSISFSEQNIFLSSNFYQDQQSTSIRNEFSQKLIKGGFLSDEIKNRSLEKHQKINRLGLNTNAELFYANYKMKPFKNKSLGFCTEAGYQSVFSGIYSDDLFKITFYGNQPFLGDTAHFSGSQFQNITFQNFGIGLSDAKTKSYLTVNFINVEKYLNAKFNDAYFTESSDSSEFTLRMAAKSQNSYSSKFNQGIGFAINTIINFEVPWKSSNSAFFQVKIKNLGFAKIQSVNRFQVDTTLAFDGFQFSDFIKEGDFSNQNIAWLDSLNVKADTISTFVALPAFIQFAKILKGDSEEKLQSFFGVNIYPTLNYVPKIFLGLDYKFLSKFHCGGSASYGGFGKFRAGIYANYQSQKINFGIGTEEVYGLISNQAFGKMFNVKFICTI